MEETRKLTAFFEKFKSFESKNGEDDFSEENTNFNFSEWVDQLRDDLFADKFKLARDVLDLTKDTPYAEFQYSWQFVQKVISELKSHFNWTDIVYPNEVDYYDLQSLSTFIYSLLNRLTMDRHIVANEEYLAELTASLTEQGYKGQELGIKIRDKLKRVTFSNWRYNPLIKQFDKSYLWDRYLKESRNVNEHYGILFKTGDPSKFDEAPATFYAEIILETYIFLYYIKYYTLAFKKAELIDKKKF